MLEENIEFGDVSNIGQKPVSTMDKFHSQFALNRLIYRDNNNFVQFNHATTMDDKYGLASPEFYGFVNVNAKPFFTMPAFVHEETVTVDGSDIQTQDSVILSLFFFVDDYKIDHTRQVYTVI